MPGRRPPGSPRANRAARATRAMIDLLYAVASCTDLVGSWEVSGQAEGLVVRLRCPELHDSEPSAAEQAQQMVKAFLPGGYEIVSTSAAARAEGRAGETWRGVAEVVLVALG